MARDQRSKPRNKRRGKGKRRRGKGEGRQAPVTHDPADALARLINQGVHRGKDGSIKIDPDVLRAIRQDRYRRASITSVPSTTRNLYRDHGGQAVSKGHGRMGMVTLRGLRDLRDRLPITNVIHRARQVQIKKVSRKWTGRRGDLGWRVGHKDQHDPKIKVPEGFQRWITQFERLMERPHPVYCKTSAALMAQLEEDYLTINRPAIEVIHGLYHPDRVTGFRPVDGGILWPTLLYAEKWVQEHPTFGNYETATLPTQDQLELLSLHLDLDVCGAEFVLVREGLAEAVYAPNKLVIFPEDTRTDVKYAGYPPGRVEEALALILAFWNAWKYNTSYFTDGMLAEFILGVVGDVHPDDVKAFLDTFREASQGVTRAWKPPIVPLPKDGALQKFDLRKTNTEMGFEGWISFLVSQICALYRMDPSTVNAKPWAAGSSPSLSEGNRDTEIELAEADGLHNDLEHITQNGLNVLAQRCHPDLRVFWETGTHDPKAEAEVYEIQARVSKTRNEIRLEDGQEPRGFWVPFDEYRRWCDDLVKQDEPDEKLMSKIQRYEANPWNQPTDGSFQSAMMGQAEANQPQEGAEDDGFGEMGPDGFGAPPPGGPGGPPGMPGAAPGGPGAPPPGGGPGGPPGAGEMPPQALQKAHPVTIWVEPLHLH